MSEKPIKPLRPIENIARIVALIICLSVPGVWVALHAAVVLMTTAGAESAPLDPYIAGMNNLVLLVTGAAIALAFQTGQTTEQAIAAMQKSEPEVTPYSQPSGGYDDASCATCGTDQSNVFIEEEYPDERR